MKILLVNTHPNGGAAKACIRLHLALLNIGVTSKLLFLGKRNSQIPESMSFIEAFEKKNGVQKQLKRKIHYLKYQLPINQRPNGYEGFHSINSIYDITQHPAYQWADIINLHWVANFLDFPSFFKNNTKPIIWTLHDMWPFTGGYHYEIGLDKKAYRSLIKKNLQVKEKALSNQKLEVVSPSKWLLEKSEASTSFASFKHHLIPYGISPSLFKPMEKELARNILQIPNDKQILLFVADTIFNKRKGFHLMLDALNHLNDDEVTLVVIGKLEGSPIRQKNIIYLNQINNERLMHIGYSIANLFVISSVEDNLPNTVLESLFCGIPVVGFNIGGIPDMIQDGQNGFLCPKIDPTTLAQTIKKALNTSFDQKAIRENAIQKYKPELQAERYIKLFQSLVPAPFQTERSRSSDARKKRNIGERS